MKSKSNVIDFVKQKLQKIQKSPIIKEIQWGHFSGKSNRVDIVTYGFANGKQMRVAFRIGRSELKSQTSGRNDGVESKRIWSSVSNEEISPTLFAYEHIQDGYTLVASEALDFDLHTYLLQNKLSDRNFEFICTNICELLDKTAKLNITHLDINTRNIVVSVDKQNDLTKIKIIDWDKPGCTPISADEQSAFAWLMKAQLALIMLFGYMINPFYQKLSHPPANTEVMFTKKHSVQNISHAEQLKWYIDHVYNENFLQHLTEQDRTDIYEFNFLKMFLDKKRRGDVSAFLMSMIKKDHAVYISHMNAAKTSILAGNNGISDLEFALQMVDNEQSLNFLFESKNEDIWESAEHVMESMEDKQGLESTVKLLLDISFAICHPGINMRCVHKAVAAAQIVGADAVSEFLAGILAKWKNKNRKHENIINCIRAYDLRIHDRLSAKKRRIL